MLFHVGYKKRARCLIENHKMNVQKDNKTVSHGKYFITHLILDHAILTWRYKYLYEYFCMPKYSSLINANKIASTIWIIFIINEVLFSKLVKFHFEIWFTFDINQKLYKVWIAYKIRPIKSKMQTMFGLILLWCKNMRKFFWYLECANDLRY